ncbi:MAG: hypothetical protein IJC07_00845 [Clostridia bacterium]|nr:hypothetical protein [Clostridia bacterium]
MKKIIVSDVTLKSIEEQKLSLTFREKLAISEKLDLAKVDCIELPLLANLKENEVICRTIASSVKGAVIKIPVGSDLESLDVAVQCVKDAANFCLQVVMPVSTAQMEYHYHLKAPAMIEKIAELIIKAKEKCEKVEFVAKDAFRAEEGFLIKCVKTAVEAGATEVTISDDAGIAFPEDFYNAVKEIKDVFDVKVNVQPSNALSLECASAISALKAGADGVKTSVMGGLSVDVLAEVFRAKKFDLNLDINVDVTKIKTVCDKISGQVINQAEDSAEQKCEKLNAKANLSQVCSAVKQLGYELSDSDMGKVFDEFKKVTSKKEAIDVKELEAIIASTAMQVPSTYHLVNFVVNSSNIISATANVTLEKDGEKLTGVSTGDGPIDAAFHAIEQIVGHHYELDDFQVHAVTKGRGAVGSSIIRLRANGKLYSGNGVSTDIIGACIRAFINALNKIVYEEN